MAIVIPSSCALATDILRNDELGPSIAGTSASEEFHSFSHVGSDFDFSASLSEVDGGPWLAARMSSADELFFNGLIRPLWLQYPGQLEQNSAPQPAVSMLKDEYFDFRSSADYSFSTPQSPSKEEQRKQRLEYMKLLTQPSLHEEDQWRKTGGKERTRSADERNVPATSKQQRSAVADENRRQFREAAPCRRARSLSPLRVFHLDDHAGQSFKSDLSDTTTSFKKEIYNIGSEDCKTLLEPRPMGRRLTLKELLRKSDSIDKEVRHWGIAAGSKKAEGLKNRAKLAAQPRISVPSRTSKMLRSTASRQQGSVSPHERHYTSQRAKAEQLKKRTFLPYRQSLLSCWGFLPARFCSVVDVQSSYRSNT